MQYRSNCVRDLDNVQAPKEEHIERWDTPDFYEFNRVFRMPRAEFVYLIKGIAYEKKFSINVNGDNMTKNYRLLNFRCGDSLWKIRARDKKASDKCCFHLQYVEEPEQKDTYRLITYVSQHKHPLNATVPFDMLEYFSKTKSDRYGETKNSANRGDRRDWKAEFMRSLTYELTTIYADQIQQQKTRGVKELHYPQLPLS